jgi:hypothetical protein
MVYVVSIQGHRREVRLGVWSKNRIDCTHNIGSIRTVG